MKKLLVFISIIITFNVEKSLSEEKVMVQYMKQKMDHFDPKNLAQWNMKFMYIDTYHSEGGPIFISVGGENKITSEHFAKGHFFNIGKELQAYFFHTEHRYYGDSHATPDMSVENLKYLNMRQAIDDLAHFIRAMKQIYARLADSKVILNGISYAGGLVFWFKHLYPDLVDGVWASSPALFGLLNFHEAGKIVGDSIKLVGTEQCYERIKDGIAVLESRMTKEQEDEVKNLLNICPNFDTSKKFDVWNTFAVISTMLANSVQVHSPANKQINQLCEAVLGSSSPLNGLVRILRATIFKRQPCNDVTYRTGVGRASDTRIFRNRESPRPFDYQRCHEFGWFTTSENPDSFLKSVPLTYYLKKCADVFADQFYTVDKMNEKITERNEFYNALTPRVNDIIVTHGELDLWKAVGTLPHIKAEMIPLYGHGRDSSSISSDDTPRMRQVKEKVRNSIRGWVEEAA